MENIFYANRNQKRAEIAILKLAKIDFNSKAITRDKESPYTTIKELVYQEAITINIYTSSIGVPKYIKQLLIYLRQK